MALNVCYVHWIKTIHHSLSCDYCMTSRHSDTRGSLLREQLALRARYSLAGSHSCQSDETPCNITLSDVLSNSRDTLDKRPKIMVFVKQALTSLYLTTACGVIGVPLRIIPTCNDP